MSGLERRRKLGFGKDRLRRVNSVPVPVLQMRELGMSGSQGSWPQDSLLCYFVLRSLRFSKQWFDHSQARAMQDSSSLSYPLGMASLRYTMKVRVCTGGGWEVWEHSLIMSQLRFTPRRCLSCRTQVNEHTQTNRNIPHQLTYLPVSYLKTRNISESWKQFKTV